MQTMQQCNIKKQSARRQQWHYSLLMFRVFPSHISLSSLMLAVLYCLIARGTNEFLSLSVVHLRENSHSMELTELFLFGKDRIQGLTLVGQDGPDLGACPLLHHLSHRAQAQSNNGACLPNEPVHTWNVDFAGAAPQHMIADAVRMLETID